MWKVLKPTDIEEAKRALISRRAAILKRQAEEMEGLNSDGAELERLARLIDAFSQKFKKPAAGNKMPAAAITASRELASAVPTEPATPDPAMADPAMAEPPTPALPEPAVAMPAASDVVPVKKPPEPVRLAYRGHDKPYGRAAHADRRNLSGTNFEMFSRAVSKSAS